MPDGSIERSVQAEIRDLWNSDLIERISSNHPVDLGISFQLVAEKTGWFIMFQKPALAFWTRHSGVIQTIALCRRLLLFTQLQRQFLQPLL